VNSSFIRSLIVIIVLNISGLGLKAQNDSTSIPNPELQTFETYKDIGYNQTLRPQFHFTSLKNWLNDPNGLVWYDGEYHLYFQQNPSNTIWQNVLVWGHAVSTDMVHWTQLPHAIIPAKNHGGIWSGTAAVDQNNTLGKQIGSTKTLIAYFTYNGGQSAAYSTDKGRTYQFLNEGKPIVLNPEYKGARDPKIFWHEESKSWIMVLWVKMVENEGKPNEKPAKVRFYNSKNLINWTLTSELNRNWAYECMDFVELPVDGNSNNKKWLLYDASFDYEVGDFDGKTFTSDKKVLLGDYGPNFYAGQTFNNSPDSRTVMIGWMRGGNLFQKAEMPFSQQMSFPNTLELKTTPEGIRLYRWPIKEIKKLYSKNYKFDNLSLEKTNEKLAEIKAELIDLSVEFETKNPLKISIHGLDVIYDSKTDSISFGKTRIPAPSFQSKVSLRILLDRASLELFVNKGASVATFYAVPKVENQRIILSGEKETKINSLIINELKSIWNNYK
jgi:fructan beta-fructosidase